MSRAGLWLHDHTRQELALAAAGPAKWSIEVSGTPTRRSSARLSGRRGVFRSAPNLTEGAPLDSRAWLGALSSLGPEKAPKRAFFKESTRDVPEVGSAASGLSLAVSFSGFLSTFVGAVLDGGVGLEAGLLGIDELLTLDIAGTPLCFYCVLSKECHGGPVTGYTETLPMLQACEHSFSLPPPDAEELDFPGLITSG